MDIDKARRLFALPDQEPKQPEPEQEFDADPVPPPHSTDRAMKMAVALAAKRNKKYAMLSGGDAVLLFGRHNGSRISAMAVLPEGRDYLRWMLGQSFDDELLKVVRQWLART